MINSCPIELKPGFAMSPTRHPPADPARIRLFTDQPLEAGLPVTFETDQAHYLSRVMRRGPGDTICLFNGRDGEWLATLDELARGAARARVVEQSAPQRDGPDLWLLFSPIKFGKIDFLAAKATELGAAALGAVITGHTRVARVNEARLRANAVEAAEQTGRVSVPEILPTRRLRTVLDDWPRERRLLLCDETGGAPIAEALGAARESGLASAPWAVLIGPEGGFTADELDELRARDRVLRVSLGPRLLRADTAALAALACWQAVLGDWRTVSGRSPSHLPGRTIRAKGGAG